MGADGAQDDPVTGSRSLVSRRNVLRAAGAAGAAVWVAPVVESFTSYAVAGSAPTTALSFGCSWVYVVWEKSDTVYYTGWQYPTSTVCNSDAAYPSANNKNTSVSFTCTSTKYTLEPTGEPPEILYSGTIGHGSLKSTTDGCANFTYSGSGGRTIKASPNTTILAAFSSGGNAVTTICPKTISASNSLTVTCSGQSTISTTG